MLSVLPKVCLFPVILFQKPVCHFGLPIWTYRCLKYQHLTLCYLPWSLQSIYPICAPQRQALSAAWDQKEELLTGTIPECRRENLVRQDSHFRKFQIKLEVSSNLSKTNITNKPFCAPLLSWILVLPQVATEVSLFKGNQALSVNFGKIQSSLPF